MARYLIRRLLLIVPTLVGLSILSFTISHVVPADPARLAAGPRATPDMIETIRHEYGLDRPVYYICGTPGMVSAMLGLLSERGVTQADVMVEVFRGYSG